ncbi:hypothetical protein OOO38_004552 [Salmonella enterica]|nr:hypothetical protein [Salmonella enterica]EKC2693932.1 hypothetical protein [Salmonella enterica]
MSSGLLYVIRRMVKSADRRGELADVTSVLCRTYCLIKAQTVDEGVPAAEREYTCARSFCNVRIVPAWFSALTAVVCQAAGCRWYFSRLPVRTFRRSVTFCGTGERPEVAGSLFVLLCRQMERDLEAWRASGNRERLKTAQTRSREDGWRIRWTAGLWSALLEYNIPAAEQQSEIRPQCCHQPQRRNYSGHFLPSEGDAGKEYSSLLSGVFPVSGLRYRHIKEER